MTLPLLLKDASTLNEIIVGSAVNDYLCPFAKVFNRQEWDGGDTSASVLQVSRLNAWNIISLSMWSGCGCHNLIKRKGDPNYGLHYRRYIYVPTLNPYEQVSLWHSLHEPFDRKRYLYWL